MPTYDFIFVIIHSIKTQLLVQGTWTRVITVQSSLCQNSTQIFLLSLQNMWNCMLWQKIVKTGLKLLNRALVALCQRAQKPRIKNPKTSNRAQCRCWPTTWFLLSSIELKRNFLNSCYEPTKAPLKCLFWASKIRESKCFIRKIAKKDMKWINSARVARCQRAQKPRIKNPKTSNRAECQRLPTTRFSLSSVELKHNFLHKERELVSSPYEAT